MTQLRISPEGVLMALQSRGVILLAPIKDGWRLGIPAESGEPKDATCKTTMKRSGQWVADDGQTGWGTFSLCRYLNLEADLFALYPREKK